MYGRCNAMPMAIAESKAIMCSSLMLYRTHRIKDFEIGAISIFLNPQDYEEGVWMTPL